MGAAFDELEGATNDSTSRIIDDVIFIAMVKGDLNEEQTYDLGKRVLKQISLTNREYEWAIQYLSSQLNT